MPDFSHEQQYKNFKYVIGIDEVGRGPWAGPVVACACIIPDDIILPNSITDSKKLTDKKRQELSKFLVKNTAFCIGSVNAQTIDEVNILQATYLAMYKAVEGLKQKLNINDDDYFVLVDGNKIPPFESFKNATAIVKGDSISLSIASASIIAKVYRDELMKDLSTQFPYYGWDTNAGYGTKTHQEGLNKYGICQHHRKSFKPIAKIIQQG